MLKKIITFTLIAVILLSTTFSYAATTTSTQTTWKDSLAKLKLMGIVNEADLNLTGKMTRQAFSKIIVNSTGNYDLAKSLSGSTTFSDVSKTSAYCGYINAAANKGYLAAYSDGKFKPNNSLTYAQLCTALVKALGYTSSDIVGTWPNGYIDKAKSLGLTTGFSLKSNDAVLTSVVITMVSRMLNTNVKKTNAQNADMTLKESAGLTNDQTNWVYGEPEVVFNFNPNTQKLGSITFDSNIPILRDTTDNTVKPATKVVGEVICLTDIKDKDVVYEVYNKLGVLIYYLVVDNKVDGEVTSILPSKYSPTKIQIDNVDYELGENAKINKFNTSSGSLRVGDNATILLGYDGKVFDAYNIDETTNNEYAYVVNCSSIVSTEEEDYGTVYYTVDLLHVDGTKSTYQISKDAKDYKSKLVKYSMVDEETVSLQNVAYINSNEIKIDRYNKKVDESFITDNLKIFNIVDSTISVLNWDDIPNGILPAGKVLYIGTTGDFKDVNVMLTDDLLNQKYKDYVVQKIDITEGKRASTYTYTLVSGTEHCTYSSTQIVGAVVGSVFSMRMNNGKVSSFDQIKISNISGWYVQAFDSKRIKINNIIYTLGSDVNIYLKYDENNLRAIEGNDIKLDTNYISVKLYYDRPLNSDGKVQIIVISTE